MTANEIKAIKALGTKKGRDEAGLFVVEGEKMVQEALSSSFKVKAVYRREEIGEKAMERISSLSSPSPVLAVVEKPSSVRLAPAAIPSKGLFLALDTIRDPGNLGTILRTADWFGVDGVFASAETVDLFNPKVVQATMGAIFRVPYSICDIPLLCRRFAEAGGAVCGTFLDGEDFYRTSLPTGADSPVVIVVGNESDGISPDVAAEVTSRLFIPRFPAERIGSESLNASVATAVVLSEFRRRS